MNSIKKAIARYIEVVGDAALQPSPLFSTMASNGTVYLRNVNGLVAVVTSKGLVLDRIGGNRLDEDQSSLEPTPPTTGEV